jgi:hypothetical protein
MKIENMVKWAETNEPMDVGADFRFVAPGKKPDVDDLTRKL